MGDSMSNSSGATNVPSLDNIDNHAPQVPRKTEPLVTEPRGEKSKSPALRSSAQSLNSMNGPLYMQTRNNRVIIRRVRRKEDGGVMRGLARWFLENQTGMLPPPIYYDCTDVSQSRSFTHIDIKS